MSHLILLVSEDGGTNCQLQIALTKTAPECQVAFVGSRKEIKASHRPNVILLDLMLSSEPALDVLRWLRTEERYRKTPVFVLGSEIGEWDANEAYALGANSCLLKSPAQEEFESVAQSIATYASLMPHVGLPESPSTRVAFHNS